MYWSLWTPTPRCRLNWTNCFFCFNPWRWTKIIENSCSNGPAGVWCFFLLKGILWDLPCPADWDYTSNGKIKCGLLWEDVFLNKNEWLSFLYVYQKLESHGLVKTYLPNVCHFLGQNIKSRTLNRAIWPVSFKFYIFCNAYRTFCRSKISVPQSFPWYSQGMTIEDYLRVVYICSVSHIIHTWLTAPIVVYGINTDWFP